MLVASKQFSGQTKAQFEIIAYWQDMCARLAALPRRADIDPGVLRSHLAAISVVEINALDHIRFRLAGSEVRSVFGQEMRGRWLHEFSGPAADMWSLGIAAVRKKAAPVGGIIAREHDQHAWLRLPLASDYGAALILCHDMVLPKAHDDGSDEKEHTIQSDRPNILAA